LALARTAAVAVECAKGVGFGVNQSCIS